MFACGAPNGGHFGDVTSPTRGFGEDYVYIGEDVTALADGHGGISRQRTADLTTQHIEFLAGDDFNAALQTIDWARVIELQTHWAEEVQSKNRIPDFQGTTLSSVAEVVVGGEKRLLLTAWGDSSIVYQTKDGKFHEVGTANADNRRFVENCGKVLPFHYARDYVPFICKGGVAYDADGRAKYEFRSWESFERYANQSGVPITLLQESMYIWDLEEFQRRFEAGDLLANPVTRYQFATLLSQYHADFRFGCQGSGSGNQINGVPWGDCSIDPLGDEIEQVSPNMGSSFAGGQIGNAFGDSQVKAVLPKSVTYTPECILLDPNDVDGIMIASDGVWDVLTHEEAFSVTTSQEMFSEMNRKMESHMIYAGLVTTDVWGKKIWHHDDVSCVRLKIGK